MIEKRLEQTYIIDESFTFCLCVLKCPLPFAITLLSQSESGLSALSNEPLIGIENRSYSKDYAHILSEAQPQTEWQPILLNHQTEVPVIRVPSPLLDLIQTVQVSTGGSSLDSEQLLNVRYRMDLN